jgi:hypothetical protein
VTKAPQQALGARWACPGHDTDSRATDAAARILCAEVPAPLIVLAVIMAATRQHPVAIWAGPTAPAASRSWRPDVVLHPLIEVGRSDINHAKGTRENKVKKLLI